MTMMAAQQNRSHAASGDVCASARAFFSILLIWGTVAAVSLFVILHQLILVRLLTVLLSGLIPLVLHHPGFRLGTL